MVTLDNYLDNHYIHRSNWLRAAVLGANDGTKPVHWHTQRANVSRFVSIVAPKNKNIFFLSLTLFKPGLRASED